MPKRTKALPRSEWRLFHGDGKIHGVTKLPSAPPWRTFNGKLPEKERTPAPAPQKPRFQIEPEEIDLVNAAIYLRRPMLITGKPGIGKSSLVYAIAHELQLGVPLVWAINTRSTLEEGLYRYDAIGRLHEQKASPDAADLGETLGRYVKLGPLGTAFLPSRKPRVLLIDEIDKSDIDLPNDLLNIFEEGAFEIPVLSRVANRSSTIEVQADGGDPVPIVNGRVEVHEFPIVIMTSNGERDFPQPFLRRCIRLDMKTPSEEKLRRIVYEHLNVSTSPGQQDIIAEFVQRAQRGDLATDQLLNAVFLTSTHGVTLDDALKDAILKELK